MTTDPGQFGDQRGRPLSQEELFERMSEAILANVIACEDSGIPPEKVAIIVGQDGGTVTGDGMVFQTPVTVRLSEERGHLLFAAFGRLHEEYKAHRLPAARVDRIRALHNVAHKIEAIRNARNRR